MKWTNDTKVQNGRVGVDFAHYCNVIGNKP